MFDLAKFREKYPLKPYQMVGYQGETWEVISYPWPKETGAAVNIRRPNDCTTMIEVDISDWVF